MNNFLVRYVLLFAILAVFSCTSEPEKPAEKPLLVETGVWRFEMDLGDETLPFTAELIKRKGRYAFNIHNADENIFVDEVILTKDSVQIVMPLFNSKFHMKRTSTKFLEGEWVDYNRSRGYKIPVKAKFGQDYRFSDSPEPTNLKSKYEIAFSYDDTENTYPALGLFSVDKNNIVSGSFATESGDYRFLEGSVNNNKLSLSCFDGTHAFLFSADVVGDSLENGVFKSGNHYSDIWNGVFNESFELKDPNVITTLKSDKSWATVQLKNVSGRDLTLGEIKDSNKVAIVQIMGSWCPNCVDETKYYRDLIKKREFKDVQIIPVAFEAEGLEAESVIKMKYRLSVPYDIYIGGVRSKKVASKVFPMLTDILSFPTSIFIDKNGEVQRIHTGFYGPGTGKYYEDYKIEVEAFLKELLEEKV